MMKKLKLVMMVFILCVSSIFIVENVCAARLPYTWTVNGESLMIGDSNQTGNVTWSEDEKYSGGVLTLNNYTGGQLKIECVGTGSDSIFAIKLVGDNKINVENGAGIIANEQIVFIGDGKLTINADIPIGSGYISSSDNGLTINGNTTTTVTIYDGTTTNNTTVENNETTEIEEDFTKEENTIVEEKSEKIEKNPSNQSLFNMIMIGYCIVSSLIIIVLAAKIVSKKKNA